jgi:hypothetical protein
MKLPLGIAVGILALLLLVIYICRPNLFGSSLEIGRPVVGGGTVQYTGSTSPGNVAAQMMFNPAVLDDSLWMSDPATKEYYDTFNDTKLTDLMPASWKNDGCQKDDPDQFARFSVSPKALQKSEDIRGFMRLWELDRSPNGRISGTTSLLRNAVTPLRKPIPIGDAQFAFLDSGMRQDLIQQAVGSYPSNVSC